MTGRLFILLLTLGATGLPGQSKASTAGKSVDITGTWRVDPGTDVKNGPREVIIRSDSSASWGKETVRWRLVKDKIWIALGGEWEIYTIKTTAKAITLSDGGLKQAVVLKRSGPPTPLPNGIKVPKDPDAKN